MTAVDHDDYFRVVRVEYAWVEGARWRLTTCETFEPESGRWEPFLSIAHMSGAANEEPPMD